jgi:para-aminobenzoate synthetase / 4-amino-4-deoxychorismate lyase
MHAGYSDFTDSSFSAGGLGAYWPRRVRLDDAVGDAAFEFSDPQACWAAMSVADVINAVQSAEAAAQRGWWVVGFLSYEAAPAFDQAMVVAQSDGLLPLAWFAAFAVRDEVPLVEPPAEGQFALDLQRRGDTAWFRRCVDEVRDRIGDGDVYQVNLTDRIDGRLAASPFELYRSMVHMQRGEFNAFIDLGDAVVISASPELFLRVTETSVISRPMKGTRPRHGRPELDAARAVELHRSEKDRAENVMIVDLLRNDLTRLSSPGGVRVDDLLRVERFETVWQMTSTITAELRPEIDLTDIFRATFPCGSITGAPKIAAMRQITRLEPWARGLYCGTIGVISPACAGERPTSVWSVAIRTAVVDQITGRLTFGSGGGITIDSDPADEDAELETKTAVLRRVRGRFELLETLRFDHDGARHLPQHLQRLAASADYFGFPVDCAAIDREVRQQQLPAEAQRMRILVDRVGRHRIEIMPLGAAAEVVRLAVATDRVSSSDPFLCHKTTRRDTYDNARMQHPDVDDVILVNEFGELVETTIANLLVQMDGHWYTPPQSSGGLPGVGRAALIAAGDVAERVLLVDDLWRADAVAVVSSLRGVRPATVEWFGSQHAGVLSGASTRGPQ